MFFGIGYMMGPALGALLYEVGGFILPFVVVGGIGLVVATALLVFIPNVKSKDGGSEMQVKVDKLEKLTKEEREYQQIFLSELERPIAAPKLSYLDVVKVWHGASHCVEFRVDQACVVRACNFLQCP